MTSTDVRTSESSVKAPASASIETKLEMVVMAVSERGPCEEFYLKLGWRLDADFVISDDYRLVQLTLPGSEASILFGTGVKAAADGSAEKLLLVVHDINAARADLIRRGVAVSEIFHGQVFREGITGRVAGPDLERHSYASFAEF